jgi:hypothetical protein
MAPQQMVGPTVAPCLLLQQQHQDQLQHWQSKLQCMHWQRDLRQQAVWKHRSSSSSWLLQPPLLWACQRH